MRLSLKGYVVIALVLIVIATMSLVVAHAEDVRWTEMSVVRVSDQRVLMVRTMGFDRCRELRPMFAELSESLGARVWVFCLPLESK